MATRSREGRLIVVAVDEGEESMYALQWCLQNLVAAAAVDEEGNSKDNLALLYARPPPVYYPAMDGTGYLFSSDVIASMDKYRVAATTSVMAKSKKICAQYPNVKAETRVENGDARDVICEVVEKLGADMLVMGSHGYGLIKRAFLGSVSNHCAQNVKCPVLIVKRPKH